MRREKNTGRKAIGLFALLILIALLCFGVFIYIYLTTKNGGTVGKDVVSVSKIMVFTGIFFLVVAFGYVLPAIINGKKSKGGTQVTNPNDTANEANMRVALEKYTPAGESLIAGIRTGVKKSSVTCVFGDCVIVDDEIRPFEEGENIAVSKSKHATYDLYIGITERSFVIADCEENRYLYEIDEYNMNGNHEIKKVTEAISLKDVGKCFSLDEIQNCDVKKGMAGSLKCEITIKNGGYFNLMIPATGGIAGGMPNHAEYRDKIIACLSGGN